MMEQVSFSKAIGKSIASIVESITSPQVLIVFTDATFICLEASQENASDELEITDAILNLLDFGDKTLVGAGVCSPEDLDQKKQESKARNREYLMAHLSNIFEITEKYASTDVRLDRELKEFMGRFFAKRGGNPDEATDIQRGL